jgi:lysozyme family protein
MRDEVLGEILEREGWPRYTNRRADRGGPTKGGITLATLSAWRGRPSTAEELEELDEEEARAIFRTRYVEPWEFVPDDRLFAVLVDYSVTSGIDDPIIAVQHACGLGVDGVLGYRTKAAIVAADADALRESVIAYRVRHMAILALTEPALQALIKTKPTLQIHNLRGWLNRAVSFLGQT